jgi:transglutaminase-like putative cysteine protease
MKHRVPIGVLLLLLAVRIETTATNRRAIQAGDVAATMPLRSSAPSVFELLRTFYRFENDGTGSKEVMARIRILNQPGIQQRSEETFQYHPLGEDLHVRYVRVRKKDGTVVNVDTNFAQRVPSSPTPKYDLDERRVIIPGLAVGDLVEYDVVTVINRPLGPGEFYAYHNFQPSSVLNELLEVDIPRGRVVKLKTISAAKTWETSDRRRVVYHWQNRNPELVHDGAAYWGQTRTPDVQVSSFLTWEEVGRWYGDLERTQRAPSPEVKAKADELTKDLSSKLEKVEVLYNFAATKVNYINAVSLGVAGYVPHSASETLHNRSGDCKDKVALLSALLEAVGLHASSVLVNPERKLDPEIPSPFPFTHVITMLHLGKDEIWMDPSPAGLPFRMLTYPLRGKKGLVIPPDGVPHFEKVTAESPVPNLWTEEVQGKVQDDGTLEATVSVTVRGDAEVSLRQAFIGTIESAWPITVQGVIKGTDRRTDKISEVKISDLSATNEPFRLSFRVTRLHFTDLAKQTIKFRLPFQAFDVPSAVEEGVTDASGGWRRVESEPVRLGPPGERSYRFKLELPPGFSPQVPESISFECSGGTYRASYSRDGRFVTVERSLALSRENLPAHLRGEYAGFREKVLHDAGRPISARVTDARLD